MLHPVKINKIVAKLLRKCYVFVTFLLSASYVGIYVYLCTRILTNKNPFKMKQHFVITVLNETGLQVRQVDARFDNPDAAYAYVKAVIKTLNDGEPTRQERLNQHTAIALTNNHIIIVHHLHYDSK